MATILCLETATKNCSVSVGVDGSLKALVEEYSENYSHAEQLHVFISRALEESSVSFEDVDAIAVSKGPGSYTGLRIGVSAAKGLCFALEVPLISIATLKSMATQLPAGPNELIIPVLDARRMEVYASVFDENLREVRETKAEIINEDSFSEFANAKTIHLVGNGAEKCREILGERNFEFHPQMIPSAKELVGLAHKKYEQKDFEDVAYFEPYYLKDFILQGKKKT